MKNTLLLLFCCLLLTVLTPSARAAGEEYIRCMEEAAVAGDAQAGAQAEAERSAWLAQSGSDEPEVKWEELYLLSKAIYAVTGTRTFSEEWRLCVGEVILNRLASPEFPDTLAGVIGQDPLYSGRVPRYFAALRPDKVCADIAFRLLSGERVMDDASVVYQDSHIYDGGVCKSLYDYRVGSIFFCYSTQPELYE